MVNRRLRPLVFGATLFIGVCFATVAATEGQVPGQAAPVARAELRIRQLDVGQGDAALITTPEGRQILIDAGPDANAVAELLRGEGVDTTDLVIASHNHADHIGGLPEVFFAFVVRAYVENGVPHTTAIYRRTLEAVEREPGLQYLEATDRAIAIGSVTLRILPSPRIDHSQNNNSVGVIIEYGQFRALYTGDSENRQLSRWLSTGRVPRVSVVKVGHHGGRNGTTVEWVRATAPAIALISVGARNGYGHPSPAVERLWIAGGARIYRTDQDGLIEVTARFDGSITVSTTSSVRRLQDYRRRSVPLTTRIGQ